MIYIEIDPVTMMPSCSGCGMPVPKTLTEVVVAMSRWPIICACCKEAAREIRYNASPKVFPVATY